MGGSLLAWTIIMFRSLDDRFDAFGGTIAVAALAGALSGMVLGRLIDLGHAQRATVISAGAVIINLVVKSVCGTDVITVVTVTVGTTVLGGLYIPTLLTAFYNEAKSGPCPLRLQIAAEAGWDIGATLVCLAAAALCASGTSARNTPCRGAGTVVAEELRKDLVPPRSDGVQLIARVDR